MNTPLIGVPDPPHVADFVAGVMNENLFRRLEEVVKSREEATPESQSPEDVEECYQWRCEKLRNYFKPQEADKHRNRISQRDYGELECFHYNDALIKLMWQKARAAHGMDSEPTTDHWRALAMFYQGLLRHSGLSLAQIREIRHSIENQTYWQYEAELYQQRVALHEDEMREALRKRNEMQRQCQTRNRQLVTQSARRAQRLQPTNKKRPPDGSVASRIRSQTKASTGAGVAKRVLRSPRVGAKAARQR